ncbi:MAG: lipase [Candidatus Marinimicrobia bacterium]|nr:lipase [Candidatus Neomarinimicrobiota bacterium]MBL7022517.1 lipase [Candidatus Neomarinimicrobiota bacterium]MBL7108628.1 lipase [Candidatus Neomarinimicrobiota bacterium]
MKSKLIVLLIVFTTAEISLADNNYPIFLIHGFFGWGREEMYGNYYWGGDFDLETYLNENGFEVYTLSVGPISSDWDRAIEAFYQIKGGQVDYGKLHSDEFGIIQKPNGKFYEGLYPQWDSKHPIHIIGHSQGGQTARMLEYLLQNSFEEESQLLNNAHNGWIKSITTISAPLNGTTLAPMMMDLFPFAQKMAKWLGAVKEDKILEKFYDFDLEQWGLAKNPSESTKEYFKRIKELPFGDSKNFASWDLSLEGAKEFNSKYLTDKNTTYFSFSTSATKLDDNSNHHIPDGEIQWNLWLTAYLLGKGEVPDSLWYENDGIVNTISMVMPSSGEHGVEPSKIYDGVSVPGVWQFMKKINADHHKVIGRGPGNNNPQPVINLFTKHCKLLESLD